VPLTSNVANIMGAETSLAAEYFGAKHHGFRTSMALDVIGLMSWLPAQ